MDYSDEDRFSDDGFDSLPLGSLIQIEQSASRQFRRTQDNQDASFEPTRGAYLRGEHAQGEDAPPILQVPGQSLRPEQAWNPSPQAVSELISSEYGDVDLGELDAQVLEDDDGLQATVRQQSPPGGTFLSVQDDRMEDLQLHGDSATVRGESHQVDLSQYPMQVEEFGGDVGPHQVAGILSEMDELKTQIEMFARENERMRQELKAAKSDASTKAGEVAILRAKQTRLLRENDQRVAGLRKQLDENVAIYNEQLQAARAETKAVTTEVDFLKQDLAEEALRLNRLKAKNQTEEKGQPMTPRKSKVLPLRDGFDDDEMVMSPTKSSGGRHKRGTPAASGKRKRNQSQGSPIPMAPLQLSRNEPVVDEVTLPPTADPDGDADSEMEKSVPASVEERRNMRSMKWILNHRTPPNKERDVEVLSKLAFPWEPDRKLSAIVFEETTAQRTGNYPAEYAKCIVTMWQQSLDKKFYEPISLFMGIIKFLLILDAPAIVPTLVKPLVNVLQLSAEVNGVPRFKHSSASRQNRGQPKRTPQSELHLEVDSTEAVEVLYLLASGCLGDEGLTELFWKVVRYDFILAMTNCSQLTDDIIVTLNLLSFSIQPKAFGPIQENEPSQRTCEHYIIDRVTNLFFEIPQADEGQDPCTPVQMCEVRLQALSFFDAMAFSSPDPSHNHGSFMMASHPTALARLIRSMHDELDMMYSHTPEHNYHVALVNGLVDLIYGVMKNHGNIDDLQSKLSLVPGGKQKFLVALTRLACDVNSVLRSGITEETVEMAHEILENSVNPQEAEALQEVFPSSKEEDS
ncbi:hypothetical protein Egran_01080 [Elaphomyces granulatus]|uniref:DNA repair protein Rad26 n=1 Tax=Elaphomyces granulatus TaxID=519963 RepID=A0A232M412_9EURO|nr:hypothetical protein Egran_01080 [Elaphomyces granulatus]